MKAEGLNGSESNKVLIKPYRHEQVTIDCLGDRLARLHRPERPSQARLALSTQGSHAVFLQNCNHIRVSDLEIRFGGEDTIRIRKCSDIEFDHVNIRAGSRAIRLEADDQPLPDGSG